MAAAEKARRLRLIEPSWDAMEEASIADIPPSRERVEHAVSNARTVLDNAEAQWEMDHNSVDLRDKFHLLRYYIDYLRQYYEGNA